MSLFASGLVSGLVLESGDFFSQGALIVEGQVYQNRKD